MTASHASYAAPDLPRLRQLIARYDKPGPRYTSYPTVPVWSDAFGEAEFRAALGRSTVSELSLYVHVPFCERLCSFCACNRKITRDHAVAGPFLDGIEREADLLAAALGRQRPVVQLAVGGGSPNFLAEGELDRLCRTLDARFPPAEAAERSIELDPRNTTRGQLDVLAAHGFNRMSFGVQDTTPRVQRAINRVQSREQVESLVQGARELGIHSVNLDLIYGLPYQTVESFGDTLDQILSIRPDRIALYSYAHVTWISKAQRGFEKKDLPSPEAKLAIFLLAITRLEAAGYRFLGLDHFALPEDELAVAAERGELRRNFMGYTVRAGVELLALGPSGISELTDSYAQSAHDPEGWQATLASGHLATVRGFRLGAPDLERKWLIQRLMCRGEISESGFRATFGAALRERIPRLTEDLAPFVEDGLLLRDTDGYHVTPIGRLFLRPIAMSLDAYLPDQPTGSPRFSRTV